MVNQENIIGLQISVYQLMTVGFAERAKDLFRNMYGPFGRERALES